MRGQIVGVLGGMGPETTVEFLRRFLAATPVECDQDHIHVLIDSNPNIPDRTAAILKGGENSLPMMIEGSRNLEHARARVLVIPCNTTHHWLADLQKAVSIPIIDMVGETASLIAAHRPPLRKIGLLATAGVLHTGLYQRILEGGNLCSRSSVEGEDSDHGRD
ncbi:aspartate/glutamate racemase family protein [Candidatus Bipolaricaulota bacterium]|nr:aspartate/glutamate racemase family protein [Candidatus Bipolaricaulota bacterium]